MKRYLLSFAPLGLSLCIAFALIGCSDPEQQRQMEDAFRSFQEALSDMTGKLKEAAPEKKQVQSIAEEEMSKLSAIEYHVIDLDTDMPAAEMASALMKLGANRWQCSDFVEVHGRIRAFCSRRPESFLRYMQRFLPIIEP